MASTSAVTDAPNSVEVSQSESVIWNASVNVFATVLAGSRVASMVYTVPDVTVWVRAALLPGPLSSS